MKMLIDGEWCGSVSGKVFPVHNPATGEVVDQAPLGVLRRRRFAEGIPNSGHS